MDMEELFANLSLLRKIELQWHWMNLPHRTKMEQRRYDDLRRRVESLLTDPHVSAALRQQFQAGYAKYFGDIDLSIKCLSFWDDYVSRLVRPAFAHEPYRNRLVYRLTAAAYEGTRLAEFIVDEVNWDPDAKWDASRVAVLRTLPREHEWGRIEAVLRDPARTVILIVSEELDSPDETAFFTRLEDSFFWEKIVHGGSCFRCLHPREAEIPGLFDEIVSMNPIEIPLSLLRPPKL